MLAVGDYGLKVGLKRAFDLKELPKADEAAALTEHWRPYRSIATWYLWRSLELPAEVKSPPKKSNGS